MTERPTVRELDAKIETLRREAEAARPRLRRILAEGGDTRAARAEIAALTARVEESVEARSQLADALMRQDEKARAALVSQLLADATARIEGRMTELQPPPPPASPKRP